MPVISVDRDTEALTMTVVAEFDAPVERVWQLWDDPRQLEMPTTRMRVALAEKDGGGTKVTILSTFPSAEALQQQLDMGMEQGMRESMAQMDEVLAGPGR
jgi:uncharacterized protein YndB with AHSA1/START domain